MMRFVSVTSSTAARVFNIYPKKGRVAEGSDADIVIWDPESVRVISAKSHHAQVDFNIFEGYTCHGSPWITIAGGKVVYEGGQVSFESYALPAITLHSALTFQLHVTQGAGKFVSLPPYAPIAFSSNFAKERAAQPIKVDRDEKASVDDNKNEFVDTGASPRRSPKFAHKLYESSLSASSKCIFYVEGLGLGLGDQAGT